jgi:epoxyqueuosine reductase
MNSLRRKSGKGGPAEDSFKGVDSAGMSGTSAMSKPTPGTGRDAAQPVRGTSSLAHPDALVMDRASVAGGHAPDRMPSDAVAPMPLAELASRIKQWARELGFDAVGISDIDLSEAESGLQSWLDAGYHGEMDYMEKHGMRRARPAELVPGTLRVISVRLPYLPSALFGDESGAWSSTNASPHVGAVPDKKPTPDVESDLPDWRDIEAARLADPGAAVVSVYARGRDYHKVLRQRLQRLADRITAQIGPFGYRVFTDSAPVMEVELARRAGVGWRGKHTLLLSRDAGSLFFIGELFVDVPLPADAVTDAALPADDGANCGQCRRCIDACPTGAIVAPYRLDARRCISYLTIEFKGSIPLPMRVAMGNRIYGCDDCQTVCPWNKFAKASPVDDFDVRNGLDRAALIDLFRWSEADFDTRLAGTAIRRIGHAQWLRNIAIALGNALRATPDPVARTEIVAVLHAHTHHPSDVVREHVEWAVAQAGISHDA